MRTNIFAWTESPQQPCIGYVPYISVNEESTGQVTISVRSAGTYDGHSSVIAMADTDLEQLADKIKAHLKAKREKQAAALAV